MSYQIIVIGGLVYTTAIGLFCWIGAKHGFKEQLLRSEEDLDHLRKRLYKAGEQNLALSAQAKSLQERVEKQVAMAWRRDKEIYALERLRHLYDLRSIPMCSKCGKRMKIGTQPVRSGEMCFQFLCDKCREKEAQNETTQTTKI